jgi:CheY-like chemotaxis protein
MRRTRILVVDDEPAIRKLLRANLEFAGFDAMAAGDGIEALKLVEREVPDLVLLDIMMPKMDGFETCSRIREGRKPRLSCSAPRTKSATK